MSIWIEPVNIPASEQDAARVREEVFGREWRVALPDLSLYPRERRMTLVARTEQTNLPVAALTVLETTGEHGEHRRLGLEFPDGARVARYTQLAVLKEYRGRDLPARLILEARRRFVVPNRIGYTWLLFDAGHAKSSSLCRSFGFTASSRTYLTEYGCSRVLVRNEEISAADLSRRACAALQSGCRNTAPMDAAA